MDKLKRALSGDDEDEEAGIMTQVIDQKSDHFVSFNWFNWVEVR